jgi:hypothetical protein
MFFSPIEPVLERIGHTLEEMTEDIVIEPLPANVAEPAAKLELERPQNVIAALTDALSPPNCIVENGGELYIIAPSRHDAA